MNKRYARNARKTGVPKTENPETADRKVQRKLRNFLL